MGENKVLTHICSFPTQQRPLLLKGHERTITHLQFNPEGDLLFSCSKSYVPCVWFTDNGELAGTFHGHNGTVWSCDVTCTFLQFVIASL